MVLSWQHCGGCGIAMQPPMQLPRPCGCLLGSATMCRGGVLAHGGVAAPKLGRFERQAEARQRQRTRVKPRPATHALARRRPLSLPASTRALLFAPAAIYRRHRASSPAPFIVWAGQHPAGPPKPGLSSWAALRPSRRQKPALSSGERGAVCAEGAHLKPPTLAWAA